MMNESASERLAATILNSLDRRARWRRWLRVGLLLLGGALLDETRILIVNNLAMIGALAQHATGQDKASTKITEALGQVNAMADDVKQTKEMATNTQNQLRDLRDGFERRMHELDELRGVVAGLKSEP